MINDLLKAIDFAKEEKRTEIPYGQLQGLSDYERILFGLGLL